MRTLSLVLLVALAGCRTAGFGNTVLATAGAGAPPLDYAVAVPAGFDVLGADYDAALVGRAYGTSGDVSTALEGRGVLTLHAVERATGAVWVLVYDDPAGRATPSARIRLDGAGR